jgi:hypothetical protein
VNSKADDDGVRQRHCLLRQAYDIRPIPRDVDLFPTDSHNRPDPHKPKAQFAVVQGLTTWDTIAEGYRKAAEQLTNHVLSLGADQDFFIYPICFLYRCYLELRLKEILISSGQSANDITQYNHDLLKLWKAARSTVESFLGGPDRDDDIEQIENYIKQWNDIDTKAQGFRYPVSKTQGEELLQILEKLTWTP